MKSLLRALIFLFLPACSRCTGEDLPPPAPVASEPAPAPSPTAAIVGPDGGPLTIRGRVGEITVQGVPTAVIPAPMRKRQGGH